VLLPPWRKDLKMSPPSDQGQSLDPEKGRIQIGNSSRELKRAVTLFASIIMAGTFLLLASVIQQEREAAEAHAQDETYNLCGAFEEQVRRSIDSIRSSMSLLKPRLADQGAGFDLVSWIAASPEFAATAVQVSFIGADGKLVSTSLERHPNPADLSDREHVRVHLRGGRGLFVGKPVPGRLSNRVTIQVSDRVETEDGKLAGVVVFSISPDFLTTLHNVVRLGQSGFMLLAGQDSVIRAAYAAFQKPDENYSGRSISATEVFKAASDGSTESGAYEGSGPLNGVTSYIRWRKVAGYPLVALVGIGKAGALSVTYRSAVLLAGLGAAVLALTFIMTVILHREIARRVQREIDLFEASAATAKAAEDLTLRHNQLLKTSSELAAERGRLQQMNRDLAKAKEQAVTANQAKTSLLMNMSHEFRTPMHAILNFTAMALKRLDNPDRSKLKTYLQNINTSGARLLRLLNALLDLAKLESGKFDLHLLPTDLAQIARQSQIEIDSLFGEKQLRLEFECRSENTAGVYDPAQMMQVFINLYSNAVRVAPPGSAIKVLVEDGELAGKRPALHCSVADEGPGIPEAEIETIFDKFAQSSKTATGAGGSGLGLAICREIVLLHQGKIWASSAASGGAVFHVLLPTDLVSQDEDISQPAKQAQKREATENAAV
jgi:two-component system, NarL family, sensor histidine kinase BarA